MKFLLRINRWKLFILVFVLPLIGFYSTIGSYLLDSDVMYFGSLIITIISFLLFIFWLLSIGNFLFRKLEPEQKENAKPNFFKYNLYIVLGYFLTIGLYILIPQMGATESNYFFAVLPVHLYSMFGLFYAIYFIAKNLALVEGKNPKAENYLSYFFMLWFYPIGLWKIQPKINQIYNDELAN